jgi:hypothetical protein
MAEIGLVADQATPGQERRHEVASIRRSLISREYRLNDLSAIEWDAKTTAQVGAIVKCMMTQ